MPKSVHIYRPQRTQPEVLEQTFVAREPLMGDILDRLRIWKPGASRQHHLLIGPRGIGKTNFLQLAAHRLRTEDHLRSKWEPVILPEDFYGLSKISDLLLESLRLLAESTGSSDLDRAFSENRYDSDEMRVSDRCLDAFRDFHRQNGRGVVLMIENLDRLIERQKKGRIEAHRLRRILIEEDWLVTICTSPTYLDAVSNPDEPFFDFFKVQSLTELSPEQQEEMLRRLASQDPHVDFDEFLDHFRPRLRALYHFTGGNPRLTVMLYDLLIHRDVGQVLNELDLLLDQLTPFYQDRMKEISEQEAKVLETMALLPEGCTPTELARQVRLDPGSVRATFTRLERAGYIRREERRRKQTIYLIPERFFRIWHQMNHSRAARGQIQYLLEFFSTWYANQGERDQVWQELTVGLKRGSEVDDERRMHDISKYMDYIVATSEGSERYQRLFDHLHQRLEAGLVQSLDSEFSSLDREHAGESNYYMLKGYFLAAKLGRLESATRSFEHAIRLNAFNLDAHINYGLSQAKQGQKQQARRTFEDAAALLLAENHALLKHEMSHALLIILETSSNRTYAKYASILLTLFAEPAIGRRLIPFVGIPSEAWRRRYCVNTLAYLGDREAIPSLIDCLQDDAAEVRGSAATALGRLESVEAVPHLIKVLRDPDPWTRGSAAAALGRIKNPASFPYLVDTMKDPDATTRGTATAALGYTGNAKAIPHLAEALRDPDFRVRKRAVAALAHINLPEVFPHLIAALNGTGHPVRHRAADAISHLTAPLSRSAAEKVVMVWPEVSDFFDSQVLNKILEVILRSAFKSHDLATIEVCLDGTARIASSPHSGTHSPYRLAFDFLHRGRDPILIQRQQPEMREAVMVLVQHFDSVDQLSLSN